MGLIPQDDFDPNAYAQSLLGDTLASKPSKSSQYDHFIEDSASRHGVDPDLIRRQMGTESSYKPNATSNKGASGLMQLLPSTAARFGVTNIYDPQQNIEGGVKYMRKLLDMFGGNVNLALAGYNAGEGAVQKYGNKIPPFAETQKYVKQIGGGYTGNGYYQKFDPNTYAQSLLGDVSADAPVVNAPDSFDPNTYAQSLLDNKGGQPVSPTNPVQTIAPPIGLPPKDDLTIDMNQPVPETDATIQSQIDVAANPTVKDRWAVRTTSPDQARLFGNRDDFVAVPDGNSTVWVNKAAAKKKGLKDTEHIINYVQKQPKEVVDAMTGIPASANVGDATGQNQPAIATYDKKGNELVSTVTPPGSEADVAASHKAQFPQGVSVPTTTDAVAQQRAAQTFNPIQDNPTSGVHTDLIDMNDPGVIQALKDQADQGDIGELTKPLTDAQHLQQLRNQAPVATTTPLKGAAGTIPVSIDSLGKDPEKEMFRQAIGSIAAENNLTSADVDKFVESRNGNYLQGTPYTPEELAAIKKAGHNTVNVTLDNATKNDFLKSAGLDNKTNEDIALKNAQYRAENNAPNLNAPHYDAGKESAEQLNDIADKFVDTNPVLSGIKQLTGEDIGKAATGLAGGLVQSVGDFAGVLAGIAKSSPSYGAINEILSNGGTRKVKAIDPDAETLMEVYNNANHFAEMTGDKSDGKDTIPTLVFKGVGQTPEYAVMGMLPGGMVTGLAIKNTFISRANDKSWSESLKEGAKGGGEGVIFQFLPPSVRKIFGDTGTLKTVGTVGETLAVPTAIYGFQSATDALEGKQTPTEDKLKNAIALGVMHLYGASKEVAGKVVRGVDAENGTETFVKIGDDGKATVVDKQKPDIEMAMPTENAKKYFNKDNAIQSQVKTAEAKANVEVPTTEAEPETKYTSQLDEIRQKSADTKAKIKEIFPQLSNEEAADLRRQAFPDADNVERATTSISPTPETETQTEKPLTSEKTQAEVDKENAVIAQGQLDKLSADKAAKAESEKPKWNPTGTDFIDRGNDLAPLFKGKDGTQYGITENITKDGQITVEAHKEGSRGAPTAVATFKKGDNGLFHATNEVYSNHSRNGVMSALYDYVAKTHGDVEPGNTGLTKQGQSFWDKNQGVTPSVRIFKDIDSLADMPKTKQQSELLSLKEKHGDNFEKARYINSNIQDIIKQAEEKGVLKKEC